MKRLINQSNCSLSELTCCGYIVAVVIIALASRSKVVAASVTAGTKVVASIVAATEAIGAALEGIGYIGIRFVGRHDL